MRISIHPTPPPDLDIDEVIAEMKALAPGVEEWQAIDANHARYIELKAILYRRYPNKWVAFHEGAVFAVCDSQVAVHRTVDDARIPRRQVIFDFYPHPLPAYYL